MVEVKKSVEHCVHWTSFMLQLYSLVPLYTEIYADVSLSIDFEDSIEKVVGEQREKRKWSEDYKWEEKNRIECKSREDSGNTLTESEGYKWES